MTTTTFSNFRKKAAYYFNQVEHGKHVQVTRHGHVIAEVVPRIRTERKSWKNSALPLVVPGLSLSRELLKNRKLERA